MTAQRIWIAGIGLVFLTVTGCSSKNVGSTSDSMETGQLSASERSAKGGLGGPGGRGGTGSTGEDGGLNSGTPGSGRGNMRGYPLTGFSQKPGEESIDGTSPMMLSKADQQAMESREAVESREARRIREEARKSLLDIYFDFDRWGLSDEGKKNLSESAGFLRKHPTAKLVIEGHCDDRGSREYNLALGEKRAKETRHYLSDLGIHNPVTVTSYGKERPSCNEQDESCYSKNRRAHLLMETK
jgi:peptidoglycan-associated lipoprotein